MHVSGPSNALEIYLSKTIIKVENKNVFVGAATGHCQMTDVLFYSKTIIEKQ